MDQEAALLGFLHLGQVQEALEKRIRTPVQRETNRGQFSFWEPVPSDEIIDQLAAPGERDFVLFGV